mmetsp:Transcript_39858/g.65310  ORF Transcript_39858/g.65310 Transcript_39858/m.65310 type:complete len:210 (-) Transcript_39858:914-1543(-)
MALRSASDFGSSWNDFVLVHTDTDTRLYAIVVKSSRVGSPLRNGVVPYKWHLDTLILLVVNVPVLSEQMVVALPIVSHACKWRTKLLSSNIFFIEYANAMVTANGNPSGTATTTIEIDTMIASMMCRAGSVRSPTAHVIIKIKKRAIATAVPPHPICAPNFSSLSCNGVLSRSSFSLSMSLPHSVLSPTATAIIVPSPDTILVPFISNG